MADTDRHIHTNTSPAELTDVEVRQSDRRKLNQRVLIISTVVAAVIAIIAALQFGIGAT